MRQISRHERRSSCLQQACKAANTPCQLGHIHHLQVSDSDPLPPSYIEQHHHMSNSKKYPLDLMNFANIPPNDPSKKVHCRSICDKIFLLLNYIRILFQSLKHTFLVVSWAKHLTVMKIAFLMKKGMLSLLLIIKFIHARSFELIIQPTTCATIRTL